MPRSRWRIPESELRRYRTIIRELNTGGARLDLGPLRPEDPLKVSFFDCHARTVERSSVYVVSVSLLGLASTTILSAFDLASQDFDLVVDFLEDPRLSRPQDEVYRLPDGTTFHRNEVLNHRTGRSGVLRRGHQLEGILLAQAVDPIPELYQPGSCLPAALSVADPFGEVTEWPLQFRVQPPYRRAYPSSARRSVFEESGPPTAPSMMPAPPRLEDLPASSNVHELETGP